MNRIKELREQNNLTQTQLGQILNVNKSTISKYENGSLDLGSTAIAILCDYFQVSANYLLNIDDCTKNADDTSRAAPQPQPWENNDETSPVIKEIVQKTSKMSKEQLERILKIIEVFHEEENL